MRGLLLTLLLFACNPYRERDTAGVTTTDRFPQPAATPLSLAEPQITAEDFMRILRTTVAPYQKLAALHQARIAFRVPVEAEVSAQCQNAKDEDSILRCSWQTAFTNADAGRSRLDSTWYLGVGGGLARLPAMTPEGLTLVVCHELGHLFAGFPFLREGFTGLALPVSVDGQADYFAAQVCLRKTWEGLDNTTNREGIPYEKMIEPAANSACNEAYAPSAARDLCKKSIFAGMAFVKALGKMREDEPPPSVGTPDLNEVGATDNSHPGAQCRLDTFVAGALCPTVFDAGTQPAAVLYDETRIPGYELSIPGGEEARELSMAMSCHEGLWPRGARPRCWFNPEQTEEGGWMNELAK